MPVITAISPQGRESGRTRNASGAPERIRTSDLCLRRATLYPAELRARNEAARGAGAGFEGSSPSVRQTGKRLRNIPPSPVIVQPANGLGVNREGCQVHNGQV